MGGRGRVATRLCINSNTVLNCTCTSISASSISDSLTGRIFTALGLAHACTHWSLCMRVRE